MSNENGVAKTPFSLVILAEHAMQRMITKSIRQCDHSGGDRERKDGTVLQKKVVEFTAQSLRFAAKDLLFV